MTDAECMDLLRGDSPKNKLRHVLSGIIGAAEQAGMQRRPPSPIELRRHEFEAVERLLCEAERLGLVTRV